MLELRGMHMDPQFWLKAWREGRTNFHQDVYNDRLVEFFPKLEAKEDQTILVPLCGKTKDLLFLRGQGLTVHGYELSEQAVEAFYAENNLRAEISRDQNFTHYSHDQITISCGDFFKLSPTESFDLIYDRAALIALPFEMRTDYAKLVTRALKPHGHYLLITLEYDQSMMDGPPFSVDASEVARLYGEHFTIQLLDSKKPENEKPKLATLESLKQTVYILQKKDS